MRSFGLVALVLLGSAAALQAQVADTVPADAPRAVPPIVEPDTAVPAPAVVPAPGAVTVEPAAGSRPPLTPGGAFIRSVVVPGWGQSAFDAYTRGGIYFSGWTANWFMNFKNQVRLTEARNRLDLRTTQIRAMLIADSPNPDSMRAVLDTTNILPNAVRADPIGSDLQGLVRSREQQREDWIAWSIFWVLASGVDAFVTAHLSEFPAAIDLEPQPGGGVSLRLEVPLPRRRP
jgi:hypothetical protein